MRFLVHVQHGSNGEPLIECDTEEKLLALLSEPLAQWAEDKVTGEAVVARNGALERHATDKSRQLIAQIETSPTVQ